MRSSVTCDLDNCVPEAAQLKASDIAKDSMDASREGGVGGGAKIGAREAEAAVTVGWGYG